MICVSYPPSFSHFFFIFFEAGILFEILTLSDATCDDNIKMMTRSIQIKKKSCNFDSRSHFENWEGFSFIIERERERKCYELIMITFYRRTDRTTKQYNLIAIIVDKKICYHHCWIICKFCVYCSFWSLWWDFVLSSTTTTTFPQLASMIIIFWIFIAIAYCACDSCCVSVLGRKC